MYNKTEGIPTGWNRKTRSFVRMAVRKNKIAFPWKCIFTVFRKYVFPRKCRYFATLVCNGWNEGKCSFMQVTLCGAFDVAFKVRRITLKRSMSAPKMLNLSYFYFYKHTNRSNVKVQKYSCWDSNALWHNSFTMQLRREAYQLRTDLHEYTASFFDITQIFSPVCRVRSRERIVNRQSKIPDAILRLKNLIAFTIHEKMPGFRPTRKKKKSSLITPVTTLKLRKVAQ